MIWVTWRQFRGTILAGVLTPLLLAVALAVTTLTVSNSNTFGTVFFYCFGYSTAQCLAESTLTLATLGTIALPVLLGVFVGVTVFSRDLERRTHVLGLTQAVSRRRWYWTRILVVFGPVIVATAILGCVAYWARFRPWSGSFVFTGYIESRLAFPVFGATALMPAAYTALGLLIGTTFALLLRNTIGAMVLTLVTMVSILVAFPTVLREQYATPEIEELELTSQFYGGSSATYSSSSDIPMPRWIVGSDYIDLNGQPVTVGWDTCVPSGENWPEPSPDETTAEYEARVEAFSRDATAQRVDCLRGLGIDHFENRFHEDSRFWRFQLTEGALCLLLAALLAGAAARLTSRLQP